MTHLMNNKKGLIMGVANDKSIAWGIAKTLHAHGAEMAFTYQGDAFEKRVRPLAEGLGADILLDCDVSNEADLDRVFGALKDKWGALDFIVHAVAYSDKEELKGRYADTTLSNFLNSMHISCYSFTSIMRRAADMMPEGGSALSLSYLGAERVVPNYNVMGVAKAALEASVRYLANDFGPQGIRVNAISAGPMKTLAGSAIGSARHTFRYNQENAPLKRTPELEDIGGSALYLLSDLSAAVTGEIHYVDCGYNIIGVPSRQTVEKVNDNP
ncbi:MAG: SDR family oxidoreductase [Rhodospirillales bacterium]|nr:SDR family oxidoreductase [Rhodospirillales bacterium]MCB9964987.1 SDR family oxidoreductase [Rhodospirillales bacterium]MCB9973421.1 SDR family oxidoreductase [Rhodospirillales bacterium]MCB9980424.1 SDR family oxidoreductase [Rhodospirillales bacterium]